MRVQRAVLDFIRAHAARDSPHECCGLLLGTSEEIAEAVTASNVAAEPLRAYEISPVEHLAQIRRCRELTRSGTDMSVVGAYHSHPRSTPVPSPTDLAQAFEEFLYVIAGPADAAGPLEVRAYRLTNGRFEAVELVAVEPRGTATRRAPIP
jgi:proteasome lid subunit RPN8/RPN11